MVAFQGWRLSRFVPRCPQESRCFVAQLVTQGSQRLPPADPAAARGVSGASYGPGVDLEAITKAVVAVVVPLATLIGVGGRRARLRREVRDNLAVVRELEQDPVLRDHTPAAAWLQGKIAVDVARLAGHRLGTPKKPIPWGTVIVTLLLTIGFAAWAWYINRGGFVWYSAFPGLAAALLFISMLGQFAGRELPPDDDLPPGASPIRSDTHEEQVAQSVALVALSEEGHDKRYRLGGQVWVAFQFVAAMREGRYEDALQHATRNWLLCRLQSWLWNTNTETQSSAHLLGLAESLLNQREPPELWSAFLASERNQFADAWQSIDTDEWGAASRRRRISPDCDLVVLAPTGGTGGYFVTSATNIPNALVLTVQRSGDRWQVANHLGGPPPAGGMPPTWWIPHDPAVDALPG